MSNKLHINFDIGLDLERLLAEIGYSSVNAKIIKPKFTKEQNEYLQLDLDSIASLLEKFQVITNNDIQSLKAKLTIEQNADINSYITHIPLE